MTTTHPKASDDSVTRTALWTTTQARILARGAEQRRSFRRGGWWLKTGGCSPDTGGR